MQNNISALILAGGLGTRMKSDLPKVLSEVCGKSLIEHIIDNLNDAGISNIGSVIGYKKELVEQVIDKKSEVYYQPEQLGTAHAVMCAKEFIEKNPGYILVICGDAPLQSGKYIKEFISFCDENKLDLGVLTAKPDDPKSYGRIIRSTDGKLLKIVEKKDCDDSQVLINEVNSGTYLFESLKLLNALSEITNDNVQKEFYLTDTVAVFSKYNLEIGAYLCDDPEIIIGVNDCIDLAHCEKLMQRKINEAHMLNGVRLIDPEAAYIASGASIGRGTTIYPGSIISGDCCIGIGNTIIASRIEGCKIGDNNFIDTSTLEDSVIEDNVKIGPYAHLRPKSKIRSGVNIGNFVEVKNSEMKENSKAAHLTYVGDGEVGRNVNLGCGVVFANYDGKHKHKTIIEEDSFIGCNTNLIAPIHVGKRVFIAAGSTISQDLEDDSFAVARSKAIVRKNYIPIKKDGEQD